ncbi:MAG: hypothetical protein KJ927_10100 [Candidatus Eisenbacteria bacterium]|nr:hypothetical protein [Candidatus Eisenbacteria bacterium]
MEVNASQQSMKYAGAFMISAEGLSGVRSEQLEEAIYDVIGDLQNSLVSAEELQKVKNQIRVRKIRAMDMMSGIGILFYMGGDAAYGDWQESNNNPQKIELVTVEDVQRVAKKYFSKDQRNVLIINAKEGAGEEGQGENPRITQAINMIKSIQDPAQLEQMIDMFSMRLEQVEDPEEKAQMTRVLETAKEQLKKLKAAEQE